MNTHVFNERLKRFEPLEKKCLYCDRDDQPVSLESAYYISLYKIQDRTNIVVYSSVKFQKITIGVPRCGNCLNIHKSSRTRGYVYAFLFFILIVALAGYMFEAIGVVVGVVLGGLAAGFAGDHFGPYLMRLRGIPAPQEGAETNAFVVQQVAYGGWSYEEPKA